MVCFELRLSLAGFALLDWWIGLVVWILLLLYAWIVHFELGLWCFVWVLVCFYVSVAFEIAWYLFGV